MQEQRRYNRQSEDNRRGYAKVNLTERRLYANRKIVGNDTKTVGSEKDNIQKPWSALRSKRMGGLQQA